MEVWCTKKKFKSPLEFFHFLLLYNTKSRENMLKVSVSCLSEEMFICQTAGLDSLEIAKLLKTQRASWAVSPAQCAPSHAVLYSLVTKGNLLLVKQMERWMSTSPKGWWMPSKSWCVLGGGQSHIVWNLKSLSLALWSPSELNGCIRTTYSTVSRQPSCEK